MEAREEREIGLSSASTSAPPAEAACGFGAGDDAALHRASETFTPSRHAREGAAPRLQRLATRPLEGVEGCGIARRLARRLSLLLNATPPAVRNLGAWLAALGLIWWLAHDIPLDQFSAVLSRANLWLFIPVTAFSVLFWFVGETFLYSRLFSYFHTRTTFREMMPANAAQEFLQVVNMVAAGTALVFLVHRRKGVPWLKAGCTLLFQAFVDFQVIAWMALIGTLLAPGAPLALAWYYPAAALAAMGLIAGLWMRGRPSSRLWRWLYERPSMAAFREARSSHYLRLTLIRAPIFAVHGVVLYLEMLAFGIRAPLTDVLAFVPVLMVLGTVPITPAGLGPRQAVIVLGLGAFGSKPALLAVSLAHTLASIIFRIPLGLLFAGTFLREVLQAKKPVVEPEIDDREAVPELS